MIKYYVMRVGYTLFLLFFLSIELFGQSNDTIYLWKNKVPNEKSLKHEAKIMDNRKGNVTRITDVTNPLLRVFLPAEDKRNGISVIVCPGGAYQRLSIDKEGYEIANWFTGLGYTAFVLQYRVPDNELGALNDIQRAIRLVRSKSNKYNIDSEKLGVIGFSAGGSLCARASTNFDKSSYEKYDEIDTLSSQPNFSILIYPAYLDQGNNNTLTPELKISNQTPPFFIFGTADDKYGNSSLVFTQVLREHKIPVELHFLAKGGHGYGMRSGNIAAETWPKLLKNWLTNIQETIKK